MTQKGDYHHRCKESPRGASKTERETSAEVILSSIDWEMLRLYSANVFLALSVLYLSFYECFILCFPSPSLLPLLTS